MAKQTKAATNSNATQAAAAPTLAQQAATTVQTAQATAPKARTTAAGVRTGYNLPQAGTVQVNGAKVQRTIAYHQAGNRTAVVNALGVIAAHQGQPVQAMLAALGAANVVLAHGSKSFAAGVTNSNLLGYLVKRGVVSVTQ